MKIDSILKLADEFEALAKENTLSKEPLKPSLDDNMAHARKVAEVKIELNSIRKLCDMVESKYKNSVQPSGLFKFYDAMYHKLLSNSRKAKRELEDALDSLGKKI